MGSSAEYYPAAWAAEGAAGRARIFEEEAALVRRAQASDQMAFAAIVDRYQSKVFSFIHRILRRSDEAEDVAQEVFAKAFRSIRSYRHQGLLLSWLYRITVNECYEHLRRKRARPLLYQADLRDEQGRLAPEPRSAARPADAVAADRDLALKLLARVSPRERSLLLMREVEGYSMEEISRMAGMNCNTVKVILFRARRKMVRAAGR